MTKNQFDMTSGVDTSDKIIDILIFRMGLLEMKIDNIYSEARLKLM